MVGTLLIMGSVLIAQAEADTGPVAGPAAASAQEKSLRVQVNRLVRDLDANDVQTRDAAEKALIALGPKVLNYLPRIRPTTPAEVKVRLGRVAKAVETQLVEATTKATRVTLKGEMSVVDAVKEMEEQTGNKIMGIENRTGMVDVDFQDVKYWEALDQVLDQAGLSLDPYGGAENALTAAARTDGLAPRFGRAAYSGLFRFEATRVQAVRDLRNPGMTSLQVRVEVAWEPRLTPISVAQQLSDLKATDENGDEIAIDSPEGMRGAQGRRDVSSIEMDLPLQLPSRDVKKLASLKGKITALLPGRIETFEFDNLPDADEEERQKAGVTVILEELRKNQELFEVRVRVQFDKAANALESYRNWINNNEAFMLDARGEVVDNVGYQTTRQDVNEIGLAYLFVLEDKPESYKFVYRTPALIVRMPIEYELKDIDLP